MPRIYLPSSGSHQWQWLLASPALQWKHAASAMALADAWENAKGWPPAVSAALSTDDDFRDLELLLALPEHEVPLPGGSRASQTDLFVLARAPSSDLMAIAVEGKAEEPFGDHTVAAWRKNGSEGKAERLNHLLDVLGLVDDAKVGACRYQLLHRTASAVIEARRFGARHAVMLVNALDALGMRIAMSYEVLRLRRAGYVDATHRLAHDAPTLIVDVHSPADIRSAVNANVVVRNVMRGLEAAGISQLYPGFDILTIVDGKPDRLIELKSSGVDARVQVMSWNEWKTARASNLRGSFWLYLVGNLRSDLPHADPFVRAIHDPFGSLVADEFSENQLRRAVQLRVREFKQAEHLDLGVAAGAPAHDQPK